MCNPIAAVLGAASIMGAGVSMYQGSKARKAQRQAQAQNEEIAARNAQRAEVEFNRANQQQPNIPGMTRSNRERAGQGIGSTFLTGAQGINPALLPLGGISLLGQ